MKLSLALSVLLVGGSLFMSGCGDSSSDEEKVVNSIDENTTDLINQANAPKFTTEMLAGKTFYGYGYEPGSNDMMETGDRFKVIVSADASKMEIWASDGSEKHGDAATSIFTDAKGRSAFKWQLDGMSDVEDALLKVFDDGSFMVLSTNPDHFDPNPILFSATKTADKGSALYNEFIAEQTISKDILGANPWYSLDWSEVHYIDGEKTGNLNCHALFTFDSENNIDAQYIDENGVTQSVENIGSYVISDNKLVTTTPEDGEMVTETSTPIAVLKDEIIFDNSSAMFKNRADAVAFVTMMGGDEGCYNSFPQ